MANMIVSKISEDATTNANIQEEKLKQMEEARARACVPV